MGYYIESIKICNFLSYLGESEAKLSPFTAIVCNFDEGKIDFLHALNFLFGCSLQDVGVTTAINLAHRVLREVDPSDDISCYINATLRCPYYEKKCTIRRGMRNGKLEQYINSNKVTWLEYQDQLQHLGIFYKSSKLVLNDKVFINLVWGNAEEFEETLSLFIGETYKGKAVEEFQKEVRLLEVLEKNLVSRHYTQIKKDHDIVERVSDSLADVTNELQKRFSCIEEFLSHESSTTDEESPSEFYLDSQSVPNSNDSERESVVDTDITDLLLCHEELSRKLSVSAGHLSHPGPTCELEKRLNFAKSTLRAAEESLPTLWQDSELTTREAAASSQQITHLLATLRDAQEARAKEHRFTQLGRFMDHLRPCRYLHLVRHILGSEIFYANLVVNRQAALDCMKMLKEARHAFQERFIVVDYVSPKLKDAIISNANGIELNTLIQVQEFLHRLKQFGLIDSVPAFLTGNQVVFCPERGLTEDVFVVHTGVMFKADGIISRYFQPEDSFVQESEVVEKINQLQEAEATQWLDLRVFTQQKFETLLTIHWQESNVADLRRDLKRSQNHPPGVLPTREPFLLDEIYLQYGEFFKGVEEAAVRDPATDKARCTPAGHLQFEELLEEHERTKTDLRDIESQLERAQRELHGAANKALALQNPRPTRGILTQTPKETSTLYYEEEIEKLRKLMSENEVDDFNGSKVWRRAVLVSLCEELNAVRRNLKEARVQLVQAQQARDEALLPLMQHCSHLLTRSFHTFFESVLPFLELRYGPTEKRGLELVTSIADSVCSVKHLNVFLNATSVLALLLEAATFSQKPFLVLEGVDEYIPLKSEDFESALGSEALRRQNISGDSESVRQEVLLRLADCFKRYIKQNAPRKSATFMPAMKGPLQLIIFTNDYIHSFSSLLWVKQSLLSDEQITENCDSYSQLISFECE